MRVPLAVAAVLLVARAAHAQPVSFRLDGAVPIGKKPAIEVTATQDVAAIRIDLARDDGKTFKAAHGALRRGRSVRLSIGDGKAGKASYEGTIVVSVAGGAPWRDRLVFDTAVRAPINVGYDAAHLDLDRRELQFRLSRPADRAELVVLGEDGGELGKGSAALTGKPANTWLPITWTQSSNARAAVLRLRVSADDGVAVNVQLIAWSVEVAHEDVNFATDSAKIEPSETTKLDASLVKIADAVKRGEKFTKMQLYIAGHTDTVGPNTKNRKLSLDRAHAIGKYFRAKGLAIPVVVAGFGEEVLKVKTADNVDERANRRADYVVAPASAPPPFKGPYLAVKASWKRLP